MPWAFNRASMAAAMPGRSVSFSEKSASGICLGPAQKSSFEGGIPPRLTLLQVSKVR